MTEHPALQGLIQGLQLLQTSVDLHLQTTSRPDFEVSPVGVKCNKLREALVDLLRSLDASVDERLKNLEKRVNAACSSGGLQKQHMFTNITVIISELMEVFRQMADSMEKLPAASSFRNRASSVDASSSSAYAAAAATAAAAAATKSVDHSASPTSFSGKTTAYPFLPPLSSTTTTTTTTTTVSSSGFNVSPTNVTPRPPIVTVTNTMSSSPTGNMSSSVSIHISPSAAEGMHFL
jgi:hypothetical protein